eukprot:TRINITY_DN1871_c0_g2_i1.p1 TRINITY_DN1871_c0_g2~~TRINITY_DN1871_c0_g2_i1.p1  ORF type:complete len:609 (-),score=124.59 TRINITY_DN1871_c0_g2_i1:290-2116(-)
MPDLPLPERKSQQAPVLLGTTTNDVKQQVNFRVKNTFIDGEDDGAMASPANHQRHRTCPAPQALLPESDFTPKGMHSLLSTDSDASHDTASSAMHLDGSSQENQRAGKPVSFCPGQAHVGVGAAPPPSIRVKNTFIDTVPGNCTLAARRRNQTCPPEQFDHDEAYSGNQCEDGGLPADLQLAKFSASTSHLNQQRSGSRMKLGNGKQSSGARSPVARPNRAALATEDLREQFEEYPASFFPHSASSTARPATRAAYSTAELEEGSEQYRMPYPQISPLVLPSPLASIARPPMHCAQDMPSPSAADLSPASFLANANADGQSCPSGYVPYATAAAAVAYAAAWPATYMAQQQITFAARVSAGLLWPWCPFTAPEHPPLGANSPSSPDSAHSSPTIPAVAPAGPSALGFGKLVNQGTGPVVPQAEFAWKKATVGACAPGLVLGGSQQVASITDDTDMSSTNRRGPRRQRLWAHIYLHMQLEGFDLIPRLIGRGGCNMRKIAEATGAKVRIRGRGSGHFEMEGKAEAPTPLMVAVTTDHADPAMFKKAVEMTIKELKAVEGRFNSFCEKQGHVHIGPCYSVGVLQPNAAEALAGLIEVIPRSSVALDAAKA